MAGWGETGILVSSHWRAGLYGVSEDPGRSGVFFGGVHGLSVTGGDSEKR